MIEIFTGLQQVLAQRRCTVELDGLPDEVCSLGSLGFHAVLRCGPHALRIRELRVCLEEERLIYLDPRAGEFGYWDTAVRTVLPLPCVVLAPHTSARVPVWLPLPDLAPSQPLRRYRLVVVAEAPWFNPRATEVIPVTEAAQAATPRRSELAPMMAI